jgi:small subunit ribosomal protein S4
MEKRNYPPGQHVDTKSKIQEYGQRLREKQKLRRTYGLSEKQFRRFFTTSRKEARQLVSHNHIAVNGKKVSAPSYLVKAGDEVVVRHKELPSVQNALESVVRRGLPSWIELDKENMKGAIKLLPTREDITMPIKEQLIVEYYSR